MARLDRVKERLEVWRHHCVDYRTQCTPAAWKFINQEYGPQPKSLKDAAKFFGLSLANKAEIGTATPYPCGHHFRAQEAGP